MYVFRPLYVMLSWDIFFFLDFVLKSIQSHFRVSMCRDKKTCDHFRPEINPVEYNVMKNRENRLKKFEGKEWMRPCE
jgi:hypothetical protein